MKGTVQLSIGCGLWNLNLCIRLGIFNLRLFTSLFLYQDVSFFTVYRYGTVLYLPFDVKGLFLLLLNADIGLHAFIQEQCLASVLQC